MKFCHVLALVLCTTGCLTTSHTRFLENYASPYREFDTRIDQGNSRATKGLAQGGDRLTARFAGVLEGAGRFLQVEQRGMELVFTEVPEAYNTGQPAVLVQQNVCCLDDQALRAIIFAKAGDALRSSEILTKHFNQMSGDASALVVMDFANVYTVSAHLLYWDTPDRIASTAALSPGPYTKTMNDIRWEVRSEFVYGAAHAWFLVAVPLDVVTFPFQLAAVLLNGKGAVR